MVRWIIPAFAALLLLPLSAEAADICRHEQNPGLSRKAQGDRQRAPAESVESIPGAGTVTPCPDHPGESRKIKSTMMAKCAMEGCCIKADGPLSTGLNNRLPTNDDHALSISAHQPQTGGRLVDAAPHRRYLQRNLPEPDPRPPLA